MVDKVFPLLVPLKPLILKIGWNSDLIVPTLKLPVFFVTGDKDEIVPHSQTLQLHSLASAAVFKRLLVIKGGQHNDSWHVGRQEYLQKFRQFIIDCVVKYELPGNDGWAQESAPEKFLKI